MKDTSTFFEACEMYVEGRLVMVRLIALETGETIEGKREQFLVQGYSIGDLGTIHDFITAHPSLFNRNHVVIADASVEPIVPEGNPSLCYVRAHGVCKGCATGYFHSGLIDYRVPKRRPEDDPTLLAILVIFPPSF